jgi:vacuolar-type H+-ATPase subunit H
MKGTLTSSRKVGGNIMENKNDGEISLALGHKFKVAKKGLDKNEVFDFVASLINQNNEYAQRLEHLDSLRKFAEYTIIQASEVAQSIKAEVVEKAQEEATAIVADAEKKATMEAARIMAEADETSKERISVAEHEATGIVAEARQKAEELIRNETKSADEQRRSILESAQCRAQEMMEVAEKEVSIINQRRDEQLTRIKKITSDIRGQFVRMRDEMLSVFEVELDEMHAERTSELSGENEIATSEPSEVSSASE